MKKRIILLVCAAMFLSFAAFADSAPSLSDDLFGQAKEALSRLSYGEYDQLSSVLSYSGEAPSASDWESFAGKFKTLNNGTVQREVSVAYWMDSAWHIAVPVTEPKSDKTEVMILTSTDGESFSGYAYAKWSSVKSNYESCDFVTWNKEYVKSAPIIVSD